MKRRFRLNKSADLQRVRRFGKSFPHPLIVLICHPNGLEISRFAVLASRAVGNAVQRNRSKRIIRAVLQTVQPTTKPGWDLVLIARRSMLTANYWQVLEAIKQQLQRAGLVIPEEFDESTRS